jgi:hypothetical protein
MRRQYDKERYAKTLNAQIVQTFRCRIDGRDQKVIASIAIAREIATRLPASWEIEPAFLNEMNEELGCEVIKPNSVRPSVYRHDYGEG